MREFTNFDRPIALLAIRRPYVFWDADAETSQGADVLRIVYNSVGHYFTIGQLI